MTHESPRPSSPRADRQVISEEEFSSLLASQAHDFLQLANGLLEAVPAQWTQRQLYQLYRASTDLETYLDDHGAPRNRRFAPVRELCAVVRWLATAMSSLVHLDTRLRSYALPDPEWARTCLAPVVSGTALALGELVARSLEALRHAWLEAGAQWPDGVMRLDSLANGRGRTTLPADRGSSDDTEDHASDAARFAARYIDLVERLRTTRPRRLEDLEEQRAVLAQFCNEARARSFEARIHNLQSTYDSLVRGSVHESQRASLLELRGAISSALHLFEAITALSHLYERHWGQAPDCHALRRIVTEEELLGIILNDCALNAYEGLERGVEAAEEVLQTLSPPEELVAEVPEGVTLHARPISLIVAVVNHHGVPVTAEIAGDRCSAASIMQFLVLSGSHPDARSVRFRGERRALGDLSALFAAGLGESGLDGLPEQLQYLRPS